MNINHLDLQVSDVQRTAAFLEAGFGLEVVSSRSSSAIAFLSDGAGFVLVLQRKKSASERYPEGFHIGFYLPDPGSVRRFHASATAGGVEVSPVIENGRGTVVYCHGPDELLVEVSCENTRHGRTNRDLP